MSRSVRIERDFTHQQMEKLLCLIDSGKFTKASLNEAGVDMDYYVPLLQREVKEYRKQSFAKWCLSINAVPAANATAKHNARGKFVGFSTYIITLYGEPPKPMRIRLNAHNDLQVLHLGKWRAVAEFMDHLRSPTPLTELSTSAGQYNLQFEWWSNNGKSFRLLDLPAEVREAVYRAVCEPRVHPYPTDKARRRGRMGAPISAPQPIAALLQLNRQINQEASHTCFLTVPFYVEHKAVLQRLVADDYAFTNVRKLQISLSHYGFLKFFGFNISIFPGGVIHRQSRTHRRNWSEKMRALKLDHLDLNFPPPSVITENSALDGACQNIVVDWLLNAAWPFVSVHPIKLTGYVKTARKEAFEASCLADQKAFKSWKELVDATGKAPGTWKAYDQWNQELLNEEDGGVSLLEGDAEMGDLEEEKMVAVERFGTPNSGVTQVKTLTCRCKMPCTIETWVSEDLEQEAEAVDREASDEFPSS